MILTAGNQSTSRKNKRIVLENIAQNNVRQEQYSRYKASRKGQKALTFVEWNKRPVQFRPDGQS